MAQAVAFITGGARRIGASIAKQLHQQGYNLVLHYNRSEDAAKQLAQALNALRPDSVKILQCDLNDTEQLATLGQRVINCWARLDLLVNNASAFYPTPLQTCTDEQWDELINSNLKAPFFLSKQLAESLKHSNGVIINLIDIHAQRALTGYPIYSIAKAGLQMMTISLAKELAPQVRVNGIAPGPIMWPEQDAALSEEDKQEVIGKTLLKRSGRPEDIAQAVLFLSQQSFITGQILAVDGGKSLYS